MLEWLKELESLDKSIFLWLNACHNPFFDILMSWITAKWTWLPLYAGLLWLWWQAYQKQIWKLLVCIVLLVLLADQTASGLLKPLIMRLRPCHDPDLEAWIHLVGNCGGQYGFVSSHAANTFGLAMFCSLLHKPLAIKNLPLMMWFWAVLVSYSRVYVGVHFPADLIGGGLIGIFWAWVVVLLWRKIDSSFTKN
ncbi:MAG: phosphatase PAP2 family protein [Cytophagales bacterium]|nr:MAG: phosphatase PAP2 family protein [Cytophagales bacterium]TAF61228.1 MAG: phosphatase PAP2 family protein [Cytophagales bacterium]